MRSCCPQDMWHYQHSTLGAGTSSLGRPLHRLRDECPAWSSDRHPSCTRHLSCPLLLSVRKAPGPEPVTISTHRGSSLHFRDLQGLCAVLLSLQLPPCSSPSCSSLTSLVPHCGSAPPTALFHREPAPSSFPDGKSQMDAPMTLWLLRKVGSTGPFSIGSSLSSDFLPLIPPLPPIHWCPKVVSGKNWFC